jgi:hypothetical protein
MANFSSQGNSSIDWIFDSGASSHMSSTMFSSCTPSHYSSITLGDGSSIPIYGVGHVQLPYTTKPLLLCGVLMAPSLIKTIIFVGHFTHDNLAFIKFVPFGLSTKDCPTKAVIAHFNSLGDLYSLNGAHAASQPSSMVASVDLWQHHLGHPHTAILSFLLSEFATPCN